MSAVPESWQIRGAREQDAAEIARLASLRWARVQRLARLTVRSNVLRGESHVFYPALGFTRAKSQHVYAKALGADRGAVA